MIYTIREKSATRVENGALNGLDWPGTFDLFNNQ